MSRGPREGSPGGADVLERALAALPLPPPPPPVERVFAPAVESRLRSPLAATSRVAAALLVALAGATWWSSRSGETPKVRRARPPASARSRELPRISAIDGSGVNVMRQGVAIPVAQAKTGDRLETIVGGVVHLDGRVSISLDRGAAVTLGDPGEVRLEAGRATFGVAYAGGRSFRVQAGRVSVTDLGTRFSIDRTDGTDRERVLVAVEEGRVEANLVTLGAGQGLAFEKGVALGPPWQLDAKPTLTLEVESPEPRTQTPIVLRVVLSNPNQEWVGWPLYRAMAPLMLNVVDPEGRPFTVRVTDDMVLTENPFGRAIPPHGSLVLRVRFERTFASPGTYRLRAVYRPAGEVESPTSPEVVMEVR